MKGSSSPVNFTEYGDPSNIYDTIKNDDKTIQAAEEEQKNLNQNYVKQHQEIQNINQKINQIQQKMFEIFIIQDKYIDLFNKNAKIRSEAIYEAKQDKTRGTGLKILTPKQFLQRFPIALAQVKAGNNSESLLNEIRQIVYSLYQSKEIAKKVYNNIIKLI